LSSEVYGIREEALYELAVEEQAGGVNGSVL
jgi:hypothetical protein